MMGPLPFGPVTKHIQSSRGPDCNQAQFYITEYSTNHGKEGFLPRLAKHTGTGYQSNFRPGLYYSRKLDELDNPAVGKLLVDNYSSLNKIQFQPHKGSTGNDVFPKDSYMVKSGFVRDVPRTLPQYHQIRTACYDPGYEVNPKPARSVLYHLQNNDPVEQENNYHGPQSMSTENHTRFVGQPNQRMDTSTRTVGPKEGSGFTHAYNHEPITYRPNECFRGEFAGCYTWRPTANSIIKTSFKPSENANGKEAFKLLSHRAERDTGYTRVIKSRPAYAAHPTETYTTLNDMHPLTQQHIKKNDPAEYFNMLHAKRHPSISASTFQGLQRTEVTDTETLQKFALGKKEDTGYTENNCKFVETAETPESMKRFDTHYKLRFYDKNSKSNVTLSKNSHLLDQPSNGFTKSTRVHSYGASVDTSSQVSQLHPYVARRITARDPYYVTQNLRRNH